MCAYVTLLRFKVGGEATEENSVDVALICATENYKTTRNGPTADSSVVTHNSVTLFETIKPLAVLLMYS